MGLCRPFQTQSDCNSGRVENTTLHLRTCAQTTLGNEPMTPTDHDQPTTENRSPETGMASHTPCTSRDRWLLIFLRVIGVGALSAFLAAVMPANWIISISEYLGFDPFPNSPLTFYLARNLSLLYGFVGATLLILASDLPRYRPLVRHAAIGTLLFSGFQLIVDSMSALPWWWTWGESGSTFAGGLLLYWIQRPEKQ